MAFLVRLLFRGGQEHVTTNARNAQLSQLNGAMKLSGDTFSNIRINGHAVLGAERVSTLFDKVIVVNGNTRAYSAVFDTLEVNGTMAANRCDFKRLEVFGRGDLESSKVRDAVLRGTHFLIKDSHVSGCLTLETLGDMRGRLVLDNTRVSGRLVYSPDKFDVILQNGAQVD